MTNNFYLNHSDYESHYNSWASAASCYVAEHGYPVIYEGINWKQACRDHGFQGAIAKVKAAYRLRLHQRWMKAATQTNQQQEIN